MVGSSAGNARAIAAEERVRPEAASRKAEGGLVGWAALVGGGAKDSRYSLLSCSNLRTPLEFEALVMRFEGPERPTWDPIATKRRRLTNVQHSVAGA